MSKANSEGISASEDDDGAPTPDPPQTHRGVTGGGRETRASSERKLRDVHARPVKPPMKKPPVKMGRKPATPPEILDHALNDLPIIEASIAAEDVQMLKKALYLIEAYRKFLQYLKMRYQESRWWARATASPAYLRALRRFSRNVLNYAKAKRYNPEYALAFPLGRQSDIDISLLCGTKG